MRIDVLGVGFDHMTMEEAVDRAMELMHGEGTHVVVTPNPEIVEICRQEPAAKKAVNAQTWCCRTASALSKVPPCWGRP